MFEFGISVFTDPMYPNVNFNFRQHLNENDGEVTEVITDTTAYNSDPLTGIETFDDRLESNTGTYGVGLSHRLAFQGTQNNLSLNYSMSDRTDKFNSLGDSRLQFVGFNILTDYAEYMPLSSRLSLWNSSQNSMNDLSTIGYTIVMLRVNYSMFNNTFVPYANPKLTIGNSETALTADGTMPEPDPADLNPPTEAEVQRELQQDFTRFDWVFGFEWRFMKQHSVVGRASFSSYSETSDVIYFDGHTDSSDESSIDRNDYSVLFSYVYKF